MLALAKRSKPYQMALKKWLKEGGTAFLRDTLATPAREDIVCASELDFFNRWEAIDAAALTAISRN